MQIHKAERKNTKLRLALTGLSGSGKTYSALLIAYGLISDWSKIIVIDSENNSSELYADLGNYSVLPLSAPYTPDKYIQAIETAERNGFEVIILDSLSHAWAGEGGILDQQGKATDNKYKGNSWSAWREFTPKHNSLIEAILKSSSHVISTLRTKTEYVPVEENGKKQIKKMGTTPVQRDGIEYEFAVVFDLSSDHTAASSKDRTSLFDGQYFRITADTGRMLRQWLMPQLLCENKADIKLIHDNTNTPALVDKTTAVLPENAYLINNSELVRTGNGKEYVKAILKSEKEMITAWSQNKDFATLPPGTIVIADLVQNKNSLIINSYIVWKGDAA